MSWFDIVECPYCGHEHTMASEDFEGTDSVDIECENEECEKEFMVEREWTPSYSASMIEYKICSICCEKTRSEEIFISKGEILCKSCFFKKEIESLTNKND